MIIAINHLKIEILCFLCRWLCRQHLLQTVFAFTIAYLFFGSLATAVAGGECVKLERGQQIYDMTDAVSYYEDTSNNQTLEEVLGSDSVTWLPLKAVVPSFGFSNSVYWLRFDLCNPLPDDDRTVLEVGYPLLDSITLFGVAAGAVVFDVHTGDSLPFSQRPEKHRNFLFTLPISQNDTLSLYLRVQTESAVQVPMQLYTSAGFSSTNQRALLVQGVYFGIILAMMLYNAFLFFSLRESPYLLYVLFTISYFSFQSVLQGFFQQYAFDSVWWQNHALLVFGFSSILFANLFACSFLNLPSRNPVVSRILRGIGLVSLFAAVLASALPYALMVKVMLAFAVPSAMLIMVAGFKLWWVGHLPARIFTVAWSTLLVSFVLASFNKFGLLPRMFWTENIMQIGGVLEVILLSIALGERINDEKRKRIQVVQSLSASLEEKVEARTQELNTALEQLESANAILDKMSLTDGLTQIANRRSFDQQMEIEYKSSRRDGSPLSLIMIDIDHFKGINDNYGHQFGDRVLQVVAEILCTFATRPRDNVFRYGGEEFAIILYNTPLAGAKSVAEKMRRSIETSPFKVQDGSCAITISAGISVYDSTDGNNSDHKQSDLIKQADSQLYRAKANGRNRVEA